MFIFPGSLHLPTFPSFHHRLLPSDLELNTIFIFRMVSYLWNLSSCYHLILAMISSFFLALATCLSSLLWQSSESHPIHIAVGRLFLDIVLTFLRVSQLDTYSGSLDEWASINEAVKSLHRHRYTLDTPNGVTDIVTSSTETGPLMIPWLELDRSLDLGTADKSCIQTSQVCTLWSDVLQTASSLDLRVEIVEEALGSNSLQIGLRGVLAGLGNQFTLESPEIWED